MKIALDSNILLRNVLQDDPIQAGLARRELEGAELVVISTPVFCEFVWGLRQLYRKAAPEVTSAIRYLIDSGNVVTNRLAAKAGLAVLDQGGDFANCVIGYEGQWLGADAFVSFDKQTVSISKTQGKRATLLG